MFAITHPENASSRCVLEKARMTFEEKSIHYGTDALRFSISRSDYKPSDNFYELAFKQS